MTSEILTIEIIVLISLLLALDLSSRTFLGMSYYSRNNNTFKQTRLLIHVIKKHESDQSDVRIKKLIVVYYGLTDILCVNKSEAWFRYAQVIKLLK